MLNFYSLTMNKLAAAQLHQQHLTLIFAIIGFVIGGGVLIFIGLKLAHSAVEFGDKLDNLDQKVSVTIVDNTLDMMTGDNKYSPNRHGHVNDIYRWRTDAMGLHPNSNDPDVALTKMPYNPDSNLNPTPSLKQSITPTTSHQGLDLRKFSGADDNDDDADTDGVSDPLDDDEIDNETLADVNLHSTNASSNPTVLGPHDK